MKKKLLLIALLLSVTGIVSAQNPGNYNYIFSAIGNWTVDNKPASSDGTTIPVAGSYSVSNGHLNVIMGAQNYLTTDHKYRADLKFVATLPADYITLNKATDLYVAIKFIGNRPSGTLKVELHNITDNNWINNNGAKYSPAGSTQTVNGNYIYYFKIDGDANFTAGDKSIDKMTFTVADGTVDDHYTVDWIATFTSLTTDLEAYKNTKDDGVSDADEGALGVKQDSFQNNELKIYPNPSAKFFNIHLGTGYSTDNSEVKVYSLAGKLVLEKTLNASVARIDHNLSAGTYIVKVGANVAKLIVE